MYVKITTKKGRVDLLLDAMYKPLMKKKTRRVVRVSRKMEIDEKFYEISTRLLSHDSLLSGMTARIIGLERLVAIVQSDLRARVTYLEPPQNVTPKITYEGLAKECTKMLIRVLNKI